MAQNNDNPNNIVETSHIIDFSEEGTPFSTVPQEKVMEIEKEIVKQNEELEPTEIKEVKTPVEVDIEEEVVDTIEPALEEEGDIDEEDSEEEKQVNKYYGFAKSLTSDGFLSEDTEIPEDITPSGIKDLYKSQVEEELRKEVEQNVYTELESKGINQTDILFAKAIRAGVNPALLSDASRYNTFSQIDLEKSTAESKTAIIKAMHKDRGLTDDESTTLIEGFELDEKLDAVAEKAKEYYKSKFDNYVNNQQEELQKAETRQKEARQQAKVRVDKLLSDKVILGEKITAKQAKAIKSGLYDLTENYEKDGKTYKVSNFQKFMLELQTSDELQLSMYKKWLLKGVDTATLRKELKEEVEDDFLSSYETKTIKKKKKAPKSKLVEKQLFSW